MMEQSEETQYGEMLWTAPELLRMSHRPFYGTARADVYSFAIILQEIVYCAPPFFLTDSSSSLKGKMSAWYLVLVKLVS